MSDQAVPNGMTAAVAIDLDRTDDLRPVDAVSGSRAQFFETERWTAGVVGLGYVGLPLAVTAVDAGLQCIAYDVSTEVTDRLGGGRSHIDDVADADLRASLDGGLEVTADERRLADVDALFVCVPSPLGRNRQPDLSYIESAAETIARVVTPNTLVALESTTYPGTTEDVILESATRSGLVLDRDVFVAFSPERVDPGNERGTSNIPKVVGGVTPISGQVAAAAYSRLVPAVHLVSSARSAEMTKLLENVYRSVNIGLINEVAQLAHQLDIDVWEVIDAARTKPFGFQAFYPGPGVGGHCIPLDPQFLAWRAREARFATRFVDLADQVNTTMPEYAVGRIMQLLNGAGRPVFGSRVLAVGVAYKGNIRDDRESPAWDVVDLLAERGADITIYDPVVGADRIRARGHGAIDDPADLLRYDIAVVLTDHDAVDLNAVASAAPTVFDTRNAFRRRGLHHGHVSVL